MPFPNADGSCSVLSTYLAEELTQALDALPGKPLSIVERTQLEAIINEMQIGASGILNPETTKSIGQISGVKALMVGTITQIGDRVRVNARLVATETGILMASAAVSVPRTSDIDSLMRQSVPGEGGTCGVRIRAQQTASQTAANGAQPTDPLRVGSATQLSSATLEGLTFAALRVAISADRKSISIVLKITNVKKTPMRVLFVGPRPSIIDDAAEFSEATEVKGISVCNAFGRDFYNDNPQVCTNMNRSNWTTLSPNFPVNVLFSFKSDKSFSSKELSLTSTIVTEDVDENNKGLVEDRNVKRVSLSLSGLRIQNTR